MGRVENKVIIVTGAASGIGAACSARLAEEGATVILADRNDEEGTRTAEAVGGHMAHVSAAEDTTT